MNKALSAAIFLPLVISMSAHAGFISGHHTTDDGKVVNLQGLEWMPLTYTAGLSRSYVENGFTDHFGGEWQRGEWRYATRSETAELLGSLWGKTHYGFSNNNYDGALWFLRAFGGLAYDVGYGLNRIDYQFPFKSMEGRDYSSFYFGSEKECGHELGYTCRGFIDMFKNSTSEISAEKTDGSWEVSMTPNSGGGGYFHYQWGLFIGEGNALMTQSYGRINGSLLVRNTAVPPASVAVPNVISLLAFGLCGLFLNRRHKVML